MAPKFPILFVITFLSALATSLIGSYVLSMMLPNHQGSDGSQVKLVKTFTKTQELVVNCDNFFHGKPWPLLDSFEPSTHVKLCQTTAGDVDNEVHFASMFDIKTRIPIYSANVVSLSEDSPDLPRPASKYWNRVSESLCNLNKVPERSIASQIGHDLDKDKCGHNQAEARDYKLNGLHLDRGHLSPNSINADDHDKQIATFTLTNAAPQFAKFNEYSWRVYECVTKQAIMDLVPNEEVYIITGTWGAAKDADGNDLWINEDGEDEGKNPVLVPGYYWKAVCYPGSASKSAWAYALVQENINEVKETSPKEFINIQEFSNKYFKEDLFGPVCMAAGFGSFASVFADWNSYVVKNCPAPF